MIRLIGPLGDAGFDIDHQWRPAADKTAVVVAKKPMAPST